MYQVCYKNRKLAGFIFPTYEKARQAARKLIRSKVAAKRETRSVFWKSNPALIDYGYSIRRVTNFQE